MRDRCKYIYDIYGILYNIHSMQINLQNNDLLFNFMIFMKTIEF